jgi:hypothetical protein
MANEKKTNPSTLLCAILFLGGMIIGGWGWDKNESTIPERAKGGAAMMWVGGAMIAIGGVGFFTFGNRKSS